MKQYYTRFLTRTALLLALCVVVQQFKTVSQFITGPLVNLILLLAALAIYNKPFEDGKKPNK